VNTYKGFELKLVTALTLLIILPLLIGIPPHPLPTITELLNRVDVDLEFIPGAFVCAAGGPDDTDMMNISGIHNKEKVAAGVLSR
jgi:hypothetical protein